MKYRLISFLLIIGIMFSLSIKAYAQEDSHISIDGYYDDWEDKPKSILTYDNYDQKIIHDVSFLKDDEYLYIYIKLYDDYVDGMSGHTIKINVNGNKECGIFVRGANEDGTINWSREIPKIDGTYTDFHAFTYSYYPEISLGDVAVTVSSSMPNDRMEMRIKISTLEQVLYLKEGTINNGSTLALSVPDLGNQKIELMGTSTGAVMGVLFCISVTSIFIFYKKRKKEVIE